MKEKSFQTTFCHWLKHVYKGTGAFELKITKTNSLPFSAVADHQALGLYQVKHGTLVLKLPDVGMQMPFDCFCMTKQEAYVVIKYPSGVAIIPIDVFILENEHSIRRSLTYERAMELSTIKI